MKKMIVSLMLILSMFAFAAESAPSATVGYVKYSNVVTAGTDVNYVSIPVTNSWTLNSHIDPAGTYFSSMSKWDAVNQAWQTSNRGPVSWSGTFAVTPGMSLSMSSKQAYDLVVNGTVNNIAAYNLITTAGTDMNFVMHPTTLATITTASGLGDNIGVTYVSSLSQWVAANQAFQTCNRGPVSWSGSFTTNLGNPLMLSMKAAKTWPSAKDGEYVADDSQSSQPKGIARTVYYGCLDTDGTSYDFSVAPYENITFKAYITARPTEIQNQNSFDSGYDTFGDPATYSLVYTNIGNFPTAWAPGETLHWIVKDEALNLIVTADFLIDNSSDPVYLGLDEVGFGGGPALRPSQGAPNSIEGNVPVETTLHQNYPNPFNPTTTIKFDLASNSVVKLNVYNYNGQLVKSLVNGTMNAGFHAVNFDASSLSAGVYYYTMETAGKTMTQKMVLVK